MRIEKVKMENLARKLNLFADPVRLRLFFLLFSSRGRDMCVSEIANSLDGSLSNVSHQLRKLELAGIIEPKREGRTVCYRIIKNKGNQVLYDCLSKLL